MRNPVLHTQSRQRFTFSFFEAGFIRTYNNPVSIFNARNPILVPDPLLLKIKKMLDYRPIFFVFQFNQSIEAFDVWFS